MELNSHTIERLFVKKTPICEWCLGEHQTLEHHCEHCHIKGHPKRGCPILLHNTHDQFRGWPIHNAMNNTQSQTSTNSQQSFFACGWPIPNRMNNTQEQTFTNPQQSFFECGPKSPYSISQPVMNNHTHQFDERHNSQSCMRCGLCGRDGHQAFDCNVYPDSSRRLFDYSRY